MKLYTYRHGNCRRIGWRGVVEIMWIVGNRQRGLGLAIRKGSGWRTRYIFVRPSGPFQCVMLIGW